MVQFELHETNTNGDECVIRIAERRVSVSNQPEHAGYELLKIKNGKGKRTNPDLGKEKKGSRYC